LGTGHRAFDHDQATIRIGFDSTDSESTSFWLNPLGNTPYECSQHQFNYNAFGNETLPVFMSPMRLYDERAETFSTSKVKDMWEPWGWTIDKAVNAKLPIGFGLDKLSGREDIDMISLNCSSCHTSQITFQGKEFFVAGGPARFDALQFRFSVAGTTMGYHGARRDDIFDEFMEEAVAEVRDLVPDACSVNLFCKNKFKLAFRKAAKAVREFLGLGNIAAKQLGVHSLYQPDATKDFVIGPGRADAFNIGSNSMLFGTLKPSDDLSTRLAPVDTPVGTPSLWNAYKFDMAQWNSSISGSLYRNIIAAVAIKTPVDLNSGKDQFKTPADLVELNKYEQMMAAIEPPAWPETVLGNVDRTLAKQGRSVYQKSCAGCHQPDFTYVGAGSEKKEFWILKKFQPFEIGTDDTILGYNKRTVDVSHLVSGSKVTLRTLEYEDMPLTVNVDGENKTFQSGKIKEGAVVKQVDATKLPLIDFVNFAISNTLARAYEDQEIPEELVKQMKLGLYSTPYDAFFVSQTKFVKAMPLDGILLTAPYLHNDSVPSFRALLTQDTRRPETFWVGSKEYDLENYGLVSVEGKGNTTVIDTLLPGNGRLGHNYGINLVEADKNALIEYLKIHRTECYAASVDGQTEPKDYNKVSCPLY
ncbi:MAG: di-heme-cytochrome C peroxidase, partial [Pseudomonadota bacterium]